MSRAKARLSRRKLVPRSTPPMFNLIFSSIQAYTQIGLFLGALVCVGLGGLILGNSLYWRGDPPRARGRAHRVSPPKTVDFPRLHLPTPRAQPAHTPTNYSVRS